MRYIYLRHLYTLFLRNIEPLDEVMYGTVLKPSFFSFPHDDNLYRWQPVTFMYGESLMGAPVLEQGDSVGNVTNHEVYFPMNSVWY